MAIFHITSGAKMTEAAVPPPEAFHEKKFSMLTGGFCTLPSKIFLDTSRLRKKLIAVDFQ
jgi:hypothetical protein